MYLCLVVPFKFDTVMVHACIYTVRLKCNTANWMNTREQDECHAPLISNFLTACNLRVEECSIPFEQYCIGKVFDGYEWFLTVFCLLLLG